MKFFAFLLLAGCNPLAGSVRDYFQGTWTCPRARITAIARDDLHASFPPQPTSPPQPPPPEIAADPARLRLWSKTHPTNADVPPACKMMEARGCNQDQIVCCYWTNDDQNGVLTGFLNCYTADAHGFIANPDTLLTW